MAEEFEYNYKGFKISYTIQEMEKSKCYRAEGEVLCYVNNCEPNLTQKFITEFPTKAGAKKEIKKLIENYIDFEWQKFTLVKQ